MKEYKRMTKSGGKYASSVFSLDYSKYVYGDDIVETQNDGLAQQIIERLAELEDKIENGTLIELPCKVGDTLYYVSPTKKQINIEKVTGIVLDEFLKIRTLSNQGILEYFPISYLGRTLLFTIAEAEAKLKELKNE